MFTGIDFSFSRVPPAVCAAAGHRFAVSYLTDLDTSHAAKAWTFAEVQSYRAAGLGVVAVWQGGGPDRTTAWRGGYDRGVRDARCAAQQSGVLGRPEGEGGRPVYFAVDFDVSAAELATVGRYFDGIASVFDLANIGIYGGRRVIEWARSSGKARWFWQTGAWSAGYRVPGIHLFQRTPPTKLSGYDVDIDEAHQEDYGQWFDAPGGGTVPDLWMPGATRLDIGDHQPTDGGPAKAIAHITWDRNATASAPADLVPYENLVSYFGRNSSGMALAPHILWDPFTGRITQFVPANCRSKALADRAGGTRTNRAGSVVIQVETLFFPYCRVGGRVFPRLTDTPCAGWDRLNAWIRSWGVPDRWPMGRPVNFTPSRSESVWETQAGWYGHQHVPENDHQDPGSWPEFATAGQPVPPAPIPVEEDMPVIHGPVSPGYDDDKTITPIVPPTVPDGKRAFLNVVGGYQPILVRADAWVGDKFVFLGEGFAGGKSGAPAFFELPKGTRSIHLKRVKPEDAIPELKAQAAAIAFEIFEDTPAAWNVEVV